MKYITNETISRFKKFIHRLHKKEEETLLNKKKKREEIKQRNKIDKNKINNMDAPNPYNYYPNMYIPQMQINNQNPAYHNEYQNIYYLYPPYNPQIMPPFIPNPYIIPPRTLEESLNYIYNRGIVNNIIGAFFIKECQERQRKGEKRKVPISTVELNDEQLSAVSGGGCDPNACPTCGCVTTRWVDNGGYREYYCAQCGQFIKKTPIK